MGHLKFISELDLGIFRQKVAGILRFQALSPGFSRTLARYHQPYIIGTNRASQELEFGISFDLSAPLWPKVYTVELGIISKHQWDYYFHRVTRGSNLDRLTYFLSLHGAYVTVFQSG